jgi:tetratricopeptide (TPR) repeat protein
MHYKIIIPFFFFCLLIFTANNISFAQNGASFQGISDKARKYYEQSEALLQARKFDQAIAVLKKATEKEPDFAEAYFKLGNIYERLLEYEQAKVNYEKSV